MYHLREHAKLPALVPTAFIAILEPFNIAKNSKRMVKNTKPTQDSRQTHALDDLLLKQNFVIKIVHVNICLN